MKFYLTEMDKELKIFDDKLIRNLNALSSNKLGYWDIRADINTGTTIEFTDKTSKQISSHKIGSCGIRTFINGGWGFVALEELSRNAIENSFQKAIKLAKLSEANTRSKFKLKGRDPIKDDFTVKPKKELENVDISEKINLVKDHEKIAAEFDPHINNTRTLYFDAISDRIFLNSHGSEIKQKLSLLRIFCAAYAQKNGIIQKSMNSAGGLGGFEINDTQKAKNISKKSAREAVDLLDAESPKGGKSVIIMDPELTGTFIHEAFGHAAEADHILNKESILAGKLGEKVALDKVTILDDPRIERSREFNIPYLLYGSYKFDDEGIPSQETKIVENGILKNFLHTTETASRMDVAPNGHGRASSVSTRPQVRMGVTILEGGDWSLEDMIEDVDEGILCEGFQYGYTDVTTGNFQFKCSLSYKIENGEKTDLMRDVALSGMTLEVLNKITAMGKDINFSDGMCGKGGQRVRVCDGGPYIRVKDVTVGGLK
jgi:TldD protein